MSGINFRKRKKGGFTRSLAKYFLPISIALCVTASSTKVLSTPSALSSLALPDDTQNDVSILHSFPRKQDFLQQSKENQSGELRDDKPNTYEESEFTYGNQTYTYRYSTKLFHKYATTQQLHPSLPSVVFGVCANSEKPFRRNAIRNSWAHDALLFFIVAGNWSDVQKEFDRTGDLLWVGAPEDYRNGLTPKTFGFLHFGSTILDQKHKLQWDYIFKTDDDVFVNVTHLRTELFEETPKADYYGMLKNGSKPSRDPGKDKWYLSRELYADDYFPPYAPGVGYALSQKFARCAAWTISKINLIPWEDVATGILAQKCSIPLSSANDNWDHFPEELEFFPHEKFLRPGYLVKIQHKIEPWFQKPLYQGRTIREALVYRNGIKEKKKKDRQASLEAFLKEQEIKKREKEGRRRQRGLERMKPRKDENNKER